LDGGPAGSPDATAPVDAAAEVVAPGQTNDAGLTAETSGPTCLWTADTSGTTAAGSSGDGSWLDATEALVKDGVESAADVGVPAKSRALLLGGYAFSIPSNATVRGIELAVSRRAADNRVGDESVQLLRAGTPFPASKAKGAWKGSPEQVVYGDMSDLWGATANAPAPSELATLGVSLQVEFTGASGESTAFIDAATLRVYYCVP